MKSGLIFNEAAGAGIPHPEVACRFAEITSGANVEVVAQLAGRDRVHEFGADNVENLRSFRLGDGNTTKTCYAMIGDDARVHSAIYVMRDAHDVSAGYRALSGDVRSILASRVEALEDKPRSLIFYSISNITEARGMGQLLVRNLHASLTQQYEGVVLSTLSPLRTLDAHLERSEVLFERFSAFSPAEQRRVILSYLMAVEDPVQKFHMGNGAFIGDIKLGADTVGASGAMVNYVYPADREVLAANARAFKARDMETLVEGNLLAETGYQFAKPPAAAAPAPQAF